MSLNIRELLRNLTCQSDCCKSNQVMTSGTDNKIVLEINTHPSIIHTRDDETNTTPTIDPRPSN